MIQALYLSVCMDQYYGEIVAYRITRRPVFEMVSSMLEATQSRNDCGAGLILHSYQSWHYKMQFTERCSCGTESNNV